jgi:uncharacterized membrane protein HdeD (DUF308 family)
MNLTIVLGILSVVAGIAILIWPPLLSVIVALVLIALGAVALYSGIERQTSAYR